MYVACFSTLLLILLHIYAIRANPNMSFGDAGVIISIVIMLEMGFGFTAVLLSFGLSNDLLKVNERKTEYIQHQSKELEEKAKRLEDMNADLRIFAYSMSHDLKEPIRMVGSFTSLLQKELSKENWDVESVKEFANYAANGSKKMDQLINNLLSYIQINSKQLNPEWIDVEKLVSGIVLMNLRVLVEENQAKIFFKGSSKVYGNQQQLEMVFQNLISNAIKYSRKEETPVINIDIREEENGFFVDVDDNGMGIPINLQNKIFDLFQRVENTSSYQGTGIGLAICRKVMDIHKGSISFSSEEGKGTTFHLFFPKPGAIVRELKGVA